MQGDTFSFIVRIWHEALDSEGRVAIWRGSIDHVGNGAQTHFDDLDQMLQFIQKQIGIESRRSPSPVSIEASKA